MPWLGNSGIIWLIQKDQKDVMSTTSGTRKKNTTTEIEHLTMTGRWFLWQPLLALETHYF